MRSKCSLVLCLPSVWFLLKEMFSRLEYDKLSITFNSATHIACCKKKSNICIYVEWKLQLHHSCAFHPEKKTRIHGKSFKADSNFCSNDIQ